MRVFILLLVPLVLMVTACGNSQGGQSNIVFAEFKKGDKMDDKEFWKIIDYSFNASGGDLERQSEIISAKLSDYNPEEIINYEIIFTKKLIEANDYKIIAVNHIVDSPVSDDGFLYFRCWLISLGQKTFEQTIKTPDYLAQVIDRGIVPDFESMLYVSTTAYKNKTGKKEEDDTFPRNVTFSKGLTYETYAGGGAKITGKDWKESELPKLYPKLWAKFN
jgi:hypothetical protein